MYFSLLFVLALSKCIVAVTVPSNDKEFEWKKFFNYFKPDAVVVNANFSEQDNTTTTQKRNILSDSLRPDDDKNELFHPKYDVFEPSIMENENKKIAVKNFSLSSFVPSLPNPFAKLPFDKWSKKKITTTIVVQKTRYKTVYPSCLILQNVQSICEDDQIITTAPFKPKPTADIWRTDKYVDIPNPESDLQMEEFAPSTVTAIRATETVSLHDTQNNSNTLVYTSQLDDDADDELDPNVVVSTPELEDTVKSVDDEFSERTLIDSLIVSNPEIVTESSTIYKTVDLIDYRHTATIKIEKCLPTDLITSRLPLCNMVVIVQPPPPQQLSDDEENKKKRVSDRKSTKENFDANRVLSGENSRISEPKLSEGNIKENEILSINNSEEESKKILIGTETAAALGQQALDNVRQRIRQFAYEDTRRRIFENELNIPLTAVYSYPKNDDINSEETIAVETYVPAPILWTLY